MVFRQADGLAELFDPAAIVAGFDLPHSDADRERRCLRVGRSAIEAVGFRQLRRACLFVAELTECLPEAQVGLGGQRTMLDCFFELHHGFGERALLLVNGADHVEGIGVVRLSGERLAKLLECLVRAACLPEHDAECEGCFRERRIQSRSLAELRLRSGEVVLLFQRAQVVGGFRVGRLIACSARSSVAASASWPCCISAIAVQPSWTVGGLGGDQSSEDRDGFVSAPFQGQRESQAVLRIGEDGSRPTAFSGVQSRHQVSNVWSAIPSSSARDGERRVQPNRRARRGWPEPAETFLCQPEVVAGLGMTGRSLTRVAPAARLEVAVHSVWRRDGIARRRVWDQLNRAPNRRRFGGVSLLPRTNQDLRLA